MDENLFFILKFRFKMKMREQSLGNQQLLQNLVAQLYPTLQQKSSVEENQASTLLRLQVNLITMIKIIIFLLNFEFWLHALLGCCSGRSSTEKSRSWKSPKFAFNSNEYGFDAKFTKSRDRPDLIAISDPFR